MSSGRNQKRSSQESSSLSFHSFPFFHPLLLPSPPLLSFSPSLFSFRSSSCSWLCRWGPEQIGLLICTFITSHPPSRVLLCGYISGVNLGPLMDDGNKYIQMNSPLHQALGTVYQSGQSLVSGLRYLQKTPVPCSHKEKRRGLMIQLFVAMQYAAAVNSHANSCLGLNPS